jgi:tRNA-splicing ligase RtcB
MHAGGSAPVLIWTHDIEDTARAQLRNIAALPFIHHHVAAMPDVHWGMGATVGSVIATRGAVIPAAVGVDIGCGMCAVRLSLTASDLPDSLAGVRNQIERDVPVGFSSHSSRGRNQIMDLPGMAALYAEHDVIEARTPAIRQRAEQKFTYQMGTLGGGNHFIELCLDESDRVWLMLHSGSRNVGKVIAEVFISQAKEAMDRWQITPPHPDLAYLPEGTPEFAAYWDALDWAQRYAAANRKTMLDRILRSFTFIWPNFAVTDEAIQCHHNYASREHHFGANVIVTRKGAVRARTGELGIIPGSMGTRSFIVRGKGEPMSFQSCSHGAGRRMSRGEAKRTFTVADLEAQTKGVECRKDTDVIDEIPGAYKPIDEVMANQSDLVDVVHELRQVLCVKG